MSEVETPSVVSNMFSPEMVEDLRKSGLEPADVRAKPLGPAEKQATLTPMGVNGYVFPYFDIHGSPVPFYRVKLFIDSEAGKYRQIADTQNHVYFPPRLRDVLPGAKYVLITEGEKKSAAAVKAGIPCIGLSGVDSWRSRSLALPKDTSIAQKPNGTISLRLPPGGSVGDSTVESVAKGFQEFIDIAVLRNLPILIAYDTETLPNGKLGVTVNVQRAAATLGFELRHRGVRLGNIRQLILPALEGKTKTGLDDLLESEGGYERLGSAIQDCLSRRSAFPRHPNPKEYVNKKLQKAQLGRSEQMGLSLAVLTDLDSRGQRLRSPDEEALYYFSSEDKSLQKVAFTGRPDFNESPFGRRLYSQYNIGLNDQRCLGWLATQYSGEDPIAEVRPEKVLAWRGDTLYYQINDGLNVRVRKDSLDIVDNGTDNVLFESAMVDAIPAKEFQDALRVAQSQPIENWWLPVLKETRIKEPEDKDAIASQRRLLSLLYYVSPMFYRWRGTQLPVEITTGEAGSGKSTLFELRLSILTGLPKLRNLPDTLKDWNASLASVGALHVTDNVQLGNADLRQRLSDEICRLVTEPAPAIEQRKLYSDTTLVKIPVRCVFGITAIKQPFQNIDIIQRSVITELDKGVSSDLVYIDTWKEQQLELRGGRAAWLAHHLLVVQHILQLIDAEWNFKYRAKYRLINLEQLLQLASKVFGEDGSWIAPYLEGSRDKRAAESDWTLEGLVAFTKWFRKDRTQLVGRPIKPSVISEWALGDDNFRTCKLLIDTRACLRYIHTNKHTVATTAKILASGGDDETVVILPG